eukprot:gene1236-2403_t
MNNDQDGDDNLSDSYANTSDLDHIDVQTDPYAGSYDAYQDSHNAADTQYEQMDEQHVTLEVPIDESVNPFKNFKGFYSDPKKKTSYREPGGEYDSVDFMKESILRFTCYQKGYIIEDGTVFTEEEMAAILLAEEIAQREAAEAEVAAGNINFMATQTSNNTTSNNSTLNATSNLVPLGPNCAGLICGSCKATVDEFGRALIKASKDQKIKYMREVVDSFCSTKEIVLKYLPITEFICKHIFPVCMNLGFCHQSDFEYQNTPANFKQEQCSDGSGSNLSPKDKKYKGISDVDERVVLIRTVTEGLAEQIVGDVCNNVKLPTEEAATCRRLLDKKINDLSWIAKLHAETVWKRLTSPDMMFPERICTDVGFCEKWIDPEEIAKKEREIEAEFW